MEELYDRVTRRIIAALEEGRLPWVQPWDSGTVLAGLPRNAASGRAYSGINILILWHALFESGFAAQRWLTFKQAEALGGHVRKGERGVTVCYADRFTPKDARDGEGGAAGGDGEDVRQVAFLKRFTVFNVAQCEGLPDALTLPECDAPRGDAVTVPEAEAEALIAASGARVCIGTPHACYLPSADRVEVPLPQAFGEPINFYRTVLHEMGHNAASRIMPTESFKDADFSRSSGSAFGIIFARLARGLRVTFLSRRLQSKGGGLKALNMSGFLLTRRTRLRSDRADRAGKGIRIMPNARKGEPTGSALLGAPLGIIRDAALWPLCRYRHNVHWTGHPSRLDRDQSGRFGSAPYAREELVAELCSAFACAAMGIVPTVRHADYIGAWLEVLRADNRAIFRAASQASKAADYLLAFRPQESAPDTEIVS